MLLQESGRNRPLSFRLPEHDPDNFQTIQKAGRKPAELETSDMNENYQAIKAHYAASDRKDVEAMMAPITSETTWTEMAGFPYAGTYVGPESIAAGVFKRIGEEWSEYTFSLESLVDGGSTIVGVGTYSGVYKKTGKRIRARVAHVWEMDDGKVVRFEQFTDTKLVVDATK